MRHDTILPITSSQLLLRLYRVGHMKFRGVCPKSCSISSKMSLQQHQGLLLYLSLKKLKYQHVIFSTKPSCTAAYRIFMINIIGKCSRAVTNANHW